MTDQKSQNGEQPGAEGDWTDADQAALMARYEQIAREPQSPAAKDGRSVVAQFDLSGAIPRAEPTHRRFQSKDIYLRLENTIYGPITQEELAELLRGGELTGFESASADLQHWTPLIYHPKMTLAGEIDPDATHDMLHKRSTLPQASRPANKIDLEALADLADDADIPVAGAPLAAILIKPIKVSRKTGLPLPVHADLESESLEHVRERTDISPAQRTAGEKALAEIVRRTRPDPRREPDEPTVPEPAAAAAVASVAGATAAPGPTPAPEVAPSPHAAASPPRGTPVADVAPPDADRFAPAPDSPGPPIEDDEPLAEAAAPHTGTSQYGFESADDPLDALALDRPSAAWNYTSEPDGAGERFPDAPASPSAGRKVVWVAVVIIAAAAAALGLWAMSRPSSPEPASVEQPAGE